MVYSYYDLIANIAKKTSARQMAKKMNCLNWPQSFNFAKF